MCCQLRFHSFRFKKEGPQDFKEINRSSGSLLLYTQEHVQKFTFKKRVKGDFVGVDTYISAPLQDSFPQETPFPSGMGYKHPVYLQIQ